MRGKSIAQQDLHVINEGKDESSSWVSFGIVGNVTSKIETRKKLQFRFLI
jgi:hypothetical protein